MDAYYSNWINAKFNRILLKDFFLGDCEIALIPCENYNYLKFWFTKLADAFENSGVEFKVSFNNNMIEGVGKKFIFYRKPERVLAYDTYRAVIVTNIEVIGK